MKIDKLTGIKSETLQSNGWFAVVKEPYDKKQHQNEQCGLDTYIDVLNQYTGRINSVKLYENTKGFHFKADGSTHYLDEFTSYITHVPYQIIEVE